MDLHQDTILTTDNFPHLQNGHCEFKYNHKSILSMNNLFINWVSSSLEI